MFETFMGSALGSAIDTGLGGAVSSALGGLFGDKGHSAKWQAEQNLAMQYRMANRLPYEQVQGLRTAGLNPILAVSKGIPQGQAPSMGTVDDRVVAAQQQQAQTANSNTAITSLRNREEILNLQAAREKIEADKVNVNSQTANNMADYNTKIEDARLRQAQAEHELRRMGLTEAQIQAVYAGLPLTQAQTQFYSNSAKSQGQLAEKLHQEGTSAKAQATIDKWVADSGIYKGQNWANLVESGTRSIGNLSGAASKMRGR